MEHCEYCGYDLSDFLDFQYLCKDFILCPACGKKFVVEYDEYWDGENESYVFSVGIYIE